jgi:hypothetical protein
MAVTSEPCERAAKTELRDQFSLRRPSASMATGRMAIVPTSFPARSADEAQATCLSANLRAVAASLVASKPGRAGHAQ